MFHDLKAKATMAAILKMQKCGQIRLIRCVFPPQGMFVRSSYKRPDTPDPDPELLGVNPKTGLKPGQPVYEKEKFPGEFDMERPKGKVYDKKPFRTELTAGKRYNWCTCGQAKMSQPFCDGSHKKLDGTEFNKRVPKFRPMRFTVDETKEYFLCNCKQTENPPYCDGTHKRADIQEKIKT